MMDEGDPLEDLTHAKTQSPSLARAEYLEQGYYLQADPLFSPRCLDEAVVAANAIHAGYFATGVPPTKMKQRGPGGLCTIENPQLSDVALHHLIRQPALGRLAAELTGAKQIQVWWVTLLIKPPCIDGQFCTTNVGWHQDFQHWCAPGRPWKAGSELFAAWIALSDVTERSGPVEYMAGSHRCGFQDIGAFFGDQDRESSRRRFIQAVGRKLEIVPAVLPRGGVSFHDLLTFHGSGPNMSSKPRCGLIVHLRTERSEYIGKKPEGLAQFIDKPRYAPIIFHGNVAN